MRGLIQRVRLGLVLRKAKRERLASSLLNLLIENYPLEARVLGLQSASYADLPERWLHRDANGVVVMIVIGGWA